MKKIPFNKPFLTGMETEYIRMAVESGKISGNGLFTKKCQDFFEQRYGLGKCLMTSSCTDALEMAAMLCSIENGDEVIVPAYTFVSTALAFARQGARIIFADSSASNPNIDASEVEKKITPKTKAIVVVHYGGMACDMDRICDIAERHGLLLVEDCAQAFDSYYKGRPLGSFGDFATFSFHETKNVIAGEGGLLVVNSKEHVHRAEVIWEKGTNRADFSRGIVSKYEWIDTGSSFLPSEIISAFLWAQLENSAKIQERRIALWMEYSALLGKALANMGIETSNVTEGSTCNGHLYYILCRDGAERKALIEVLKQKGIMAVSHYLSLNKSPYWKDRYPEDAAISLIHSDIYEERLLRLPLFYELDINDIRYICNAVLGFYNQLP